jgi:hypothetical protein
MRETTTQAADALVIFGITGDRWWLAARRWRPAPAAAPRSFDAADESGVYSYIRSPREGGWLGDAR